MNKNKIYSFVFLFVITLASYGDAAMLRGATTEERSENLKFELDKGTVQIEISDIEKEFQYQIETPPECFAKLSIKENDRDIRFSHSSGHCQKGSKITLKVRSGISATVVVGTGNLELRNTKDLRSKLSRLSALVDKGTIHTLIPKLRVQRINHYAGARVDYKNSASSKLPTLKFKVTEGLILLK